MNEITLIQKIPFNITREDVDNENVKYIPDTDDMYAVSIVGAVYSFSYKMQGRIIGTKGPGGYITCCIQYSDGSKKTRYAHRLIAQAFIPNPDGKKQVAHKDEDRTNNRVDNLCWVSGEENCNMGTHNEKLSASIKEYYKNRENGRAPVRVAVMDKNDAVLEISPSIQAAANWIERETGKDDNASAVQISSILLGKPGFKTVGGFRVRKATKEEYKEWVAIHMNALLQEEDIELSKVQLNRLSKVDGVKIINRRMNVETGEMEYEVRVFDKGQKLTNDLR